MPYYPTVDAQRQTLQVTDTFYGYNHNLKIADGEFYEMQNLSSDFYPLLGNRSRRGMVQELNAPGGILAKEKLAWVDGGKLYYNGEAVDGLELSAGEKQLVSMGAYLIIWPDRAYYNTADPSDKGYMDSKVTSVRGLKMTHNTLSFDFNEFEMDNWPLDTTFEEDDYHIDARTWYTYGNDKQAVEARFDAETGTWDLDSIETLVTTDPNSAHYFIGEEYFLRQPSGQIIIPSFDGDNFEAVEDPLTWSPTTGYVGGNPDKTRYNREGYYAVVHGHNFDGTPGGWGYAFDVYKVGEKKKIFSNYFDVGELVKISGSQFGLQDLDKAEIKAIDDEGKTLTFADGTFRNVKTYVELTGEYDPVYKGRFFAFQIANGKYYRLELEYAPPIDTVVLIGADEDYWDHRYTVSAVLWDRKAETFSQPYELEWWDAAPYWPIYDALPYNEGYQMSVQRLMPDMDYLTQAENRLWGCKYGMVDGKLVNEIYASALGDFKHWSLYKGLSTDSYAASVGTDGPWTGAITHLGYPLFFKENALHKVYISATGAHQISEVACRGVQEGCAKSLAIVGETLYYKSRSGVCRYDGSLPEVVNDYFGTETYSNAAAGSVDSKYYISMQDSRDAWHLFVYDAAKGLWHREDDTHAVQFARLGNELYFIDGENRLIAAKGLDGTPEVQVRWSATTGIIGYTTVEQKYVSRFNLRMQLPKGSEMDLYIRYDSDGLWEHMGHMIGRGTNTFMLPIRPRRCDHFQVRIEGKGDIRLYSLARVFEGGSDII